MGHRVCSKTSLVEGGEAETQSSREGTHTPKSAFVISKTEMAALKIGQDAPGYLVRVHLFSGT